MLVPLEKRVFLVTPTEHIRQPTDDSFSRQFSQSAAGNDPLPLWFLRLSRILSGNEFMHGLCELLCFLSQFFITADATDCLQTELRFILNGP